jgi:hypothetical protein
MYINSGDDDDFFIEAEATRLYSLLRKNGSRPSCASSTAPTAGRSGESTIGDAMRYVTPLHRPSRPRN